MFFKKIGDMDVVLYGGAYGHGDIEMPPNGVVSGVNGLMLEVKRYVGEPLGAPGRRRVIATALNFTGLAVAAISLLLLAGVLITKAEATLGSIISLCVLMFTTIGGGALSGVGEDMRLSASTGRYERILKVDGEASLYAFNALGQGNDDNVFKAIEIYNDAQENDYESIVHDTELLLKSYSNESVNDVANEFSMLKKPKVKSNDIIKELNAGFDPKKNSLMDDLEYLRHEHEATRAFKELEP